MVEQEPGSTSILPVPPCRTEQHHDISSTNPQHPLTDPIPGPSALALLCPGTCSALPGLFLGRATAGAAVAEQYVSIKTPSRHQLLNLGNRNGWHRTKGPQPMVVGLKTLVGKKNGFISRKG